MRKKMALLLIFSLLFTAFLPCAAAETPLVPRVYRPEMRASIGYRDGEKYIALDIVINDITEPTGLLGIDFNVLFDGDALIPLWQTKEELNGNGRSVNYYTSPQMLTNWPRHTFNVVGYSIESFAAEGLCKSYEKTGKGVLNICHVINIDYCDYSVFGDGDFALRLYFRPADGFKEGSVYSFLIDGQYDEEIPQLIYVRGVNNEEMPQCVYGCGGSASYTVTWADCGACDLADSDCGIVPDGKKGVLWMDKVCTAEELKRCFKGEVRVLDGAGEAVRDEAAVLPGFSAQTDAGTLTIAVKGDIDRDGVVSTLDYFLLRSVLCGEAELDELQVKTADFSGEGSLGTTDALWFRRLFKSAFP